LHVGVASGLGSQLTCFVLYYTIFAPLCSSYNLPGFFSLSPFFAPLCTRSSPPYRARRNQIRPRTLGVWYGGPLSLRFLIPLKNLPNSKFIFPHLRNMLSVQTASRREHSEADPETAPRQSGLSAEQGRRSADHQQLPNKKGFLRGPSRGATPSQDSILPNDTPATPFDWPLKKREEHELHKKPNVYNSRVPSAAKILLG